MDIITKTYDALDGTHNAAIYSACEGYRYLLTRQWAPKKSSLVMLMLNPSTATELRNDPTISRCERRAHMWGYGGLAILNIFAYRATEPKDMKAQSDPNGSYNDHYIKETLQSAKSEDIVCGWGTHGAHNNREAEIFEIFKTLGHTPRALKWTNNGHPQHPLYIGYKEMPKKLV